MKLKELFWVFDAVSLYPSAMWDKKSIYPRIETGFNFATDMNDDLVEKIINQTCIQGSAILKIKHFNRKNSFVPHLPVKEREIKIEINRMRNGYVIDTLTPVVVQEIVKVEGIVVQIYEGVIYRENFKVSQFIKDIGKLFALGRKNKNAKE